MWWFLGYLWVMLGLWECIYQMDVLRVEWIFSRMLGVMLALGTIAAGPIPALVRGFK